MHKEEEEEKEVAAALILLSEGQAKEMISYEEEEETTVNMGASILLALKRAAEERFVGKTETKKPKLKREKDDSETTLSLMIEFNKIKPEIPHFVDICNLGVCSEPIRKQLTTSDVEKGQTRLMLGKEQVEKRMLHLMRKSSKEVIGDKGLEVLVYGKEAEKKVHLKFHRMKFMMWKNGNPVLTSKGWNAFVECYGLKEHSDFVTIWMFKHKKTGELCFAIEYTRFDAIEKPLSKRILEQAFKNWN